MAKEPFLTSANLGLNTNSQTRQLRKGEVSYALNAVLENFDGQAVSYQNEQANVPCCTFPTGYKVIGQKNITDQNRIVYFLTNPTTNGSEIGYVDNYNCEYITFINSPCLNFSLLHPIKRIITKVTSCTFEVYFTDNYNPRRWFDFLNPPYATQLGTTTCLDTTLTTIDCNKILVQPNFLIPSIELTGIEVDGNTTSGTYQFGFQYANAYGDAYTEVVSITNPCPIFDPTNVSLLFNTPVSKSIILDISNVDTTGIYDYFNLVVVQTVNQIATPYLVGTYYIDKSNFTIYYTGINQSINLNIEDIFQKYDRWATAKGVMAAQDIATWYGLTTTERLSYQLIANQITVNWQTWRVPYTNGYSNPLTATYLKGYMRDEQAALEICLLKADGSQTDGFHIPGRQSNQNDLTPISNGDTINPSLSNCDNPTPASFPAWKVYNTATLTGYETDYLNFLEGLGPIDNPNCPDCGLLDTNPYNALCYEGPYQYGQMGYWESTEVYPCDPAVWGPLAGQPIRHHKFPDSLVTHIHDSNDAIYPIGIKIDVAQIYNLIQKSNLTQAQKNQIVGFKILRGDRSNNKSVIAKGLIHNVGTYSLNAADADEETGTFFYPNYPYNDVNPDPFLATSQSTWNSGNNPGLRLNGFPSDDNKKRFVFHSPDTHFYQPTLGNVLKLETAEFGNANCHFVQAQKHAGYKFLTSSAYATVFAIGVAIGFASGEYGVADKPYDGAADFTAVGVGINILMDLIPWVNYAWQYDSVGLYDNFVPVPNSGNKQRLSDIMGYLIPGITSLGDTYTINNYERESSVYIRTVDTLPFTHTLAGVPVDESRFTPSSNYSATFMTTTSTTTTSSTTINSAGIPGNVNQNLNTNIPPAQPNVAQCDNPGKIVQRPISSYYASIKDIIEDQYGQIYSYNTVDTGYQFLFSQYIGVSGKSTLVSVFGGDTFINKFAYKSKLPFFIDNRINFPDGSDIDYTLVNNVAYPMFWLSTNPDTDAGSFTALMASVLGTKINNFDCHGSKFYYQTGYFYLWAYGIPYFYTESQVNVDLRQAYNGSEGDFYPHVGTGIPDYWLQDINTPIEQDNTYTYNRTYSKQNTEDSISHLPQNFNPAQSCLDNYPNKGIYSEKQLDTTGLRRNNWLIYLPASVVDFPLNYGPVTSLEPMDDQMVYVRFSEKSLIYNYQYTMPTSAGEAYLGKLLWQQQGPPLDFVDTDLGYNGSQHDLFLKTEFGGISIDAYDGTIFLLKGRQAQPISELGMDEFFTNNLPFQIQKAFPTYDIDNAWNGVGLTGVYDMRYKRFILTKLDYQVIDPQLTYNTLTTEFLDINGNIIQLGDPAHFLNVSWTLSFSFKAVEQNRMAWVSYHSYLPNFYVGGENYFFSGRNSVADQWLHNISTQLTNTYYGIIQPYILEYPLIYGPNDEIISSIADYTKVLQYVNGFPVQLDTSYFNKAWVYNDQQHSGELDLVAKLPNNLASYLSYPMFNLTSKSILYTKSDNLYQFNTFWDTVINRSTPNFAPSTQGKYIDKVLNNSNLDYSQRAFNKQRIRSKDAKLRLILDNANSFHMISQFLITDTQTSFK
jgi:hypothetical protein